MNTFLFGVLPYLAFFSLVSGLIWRHRYDQFGWTTRSSAVYERRILNWASPAFHYGILFVLAGHLIGLFVPESWTEKIGISEHTYHLFSLIGGTFAGVLAILGLATLLYRRRSNMPVLKATTVNDKVMYLLLFGEICLGLYAKLTNSNLHSGYNYRTTIGPWARSLFTLHPNLGVWDAVPTMYEVHAVVGMVVIAIVPFTRLVHMFSAPWFYLFRPYLVYRSRPAGQVAERPPRRGWEKIDA
ncbi:respiratory nitrate reductase subunit gamma [Streptacidiphilus rugosus]|uniref:respiratory nitrate reductase subunit gamma n=1 Tax=Streptacidiphilus rugosus TaxID=405783 RepID=UPI000562B060|nr:respiratory nitrate reductase subunit gamma [Streptacidiphilus rugosus]